MPTTYLAYTRISSTKQLIGVSLAEQRIAIERYARERSLNITHRYQDIQTAAKSGRSQFQALLKHAKGERAGVILHKIDRGARNLRDWTSLGELMEQGIDVRFAQVSYYQTTAC
jgi:DNA invertase Pin-like site-specific DNA recombinase